MNVSVNTCWLYREYAIVFVDEEDVATYTIKAMDEPRTLNKDLYLWILENTWSMNKLVALLENKIGKTLEKLYVSEDQLLKSIQGR